MPSERYPDVDQHPKFPDVERSVIETWQKEHTFERSVEQRPADDEFVFYDGPPFANGPIHYGHLLTGFVKDAVPRYRTMRGQRVERRFGWDCHGLPIEMQAEKELGVSGRVAIEAFGVDKFNEYCRSIVGTTADAWRESVTRQARWVDMDNDYKTMDLSYMESVMWAQQQLYDKGLLYEGYRVLPYCWECETPLSNFETRMDDAYRDRQDPAVTVWFELDDGKRLLVWTTTPWTLPSNLAVAVGPDIDYAVFTEADGHQYVLAESRVDAYERELAGAERTGTVKGRDLVGQHYTPMFPYFADTANAFVILSGDFVTTEDGTGVVHMAPGFGEDDQRVCEAAGIPIVVPVDEKGQFTAEVPDYAGRQVFSANGDIIRDLKDRGVIVRHDSYMHSYPHCWRTDTPLIYKAVSSWFVNVTAVKERMLELNQQITWVPEHVRDGSFGKWLEGARDWSISRNRFWGSPLPIWKSDDPAYPRIDVYGSLDELERDFGVRPTDLHRPAIDELVRPNPDDPTGTAMMRRIPDVLDCWFESGSMPFAQVHYPFENTDWFESHFPGDFIVEYIGQTRGWFYTLHVLATALFDKPAFSTCVVHGVLLGDDGQKLSKRLRNYPDPSEVFDTAGSDAMRWAMLSSAALRGGDIAVDRRTMDESVRHVLMPIWNAWYFLSLYANAGGVKGRIIRRADNVLDRYALAKVRQLADDVTARMDVYDLSGACASVLAFLDSLNNWYIRRSRDRFWAGDPDAVNTLHTVLSALCRVMAPLLPITADAVYRDLEGAESVHLERWPTSDELTLDTDPDLVATMDAAREVCSAAASIRKTHGLANRQPLARLTVASPSADSLRTFAGLIQDEANVKSLELTTDVAAVGDFVLQVVPAVLGPRVGKDVQQIIAAVRAGDWSRDGDRIVVAGRELKNDEYTLRLVPRDADSAAPLPGNVGVVALDMTITPELAAEGIARTIVRGINEARRKDGLHVTDRIHLVLDPEHHDDVRAAIERHKSYIADETLAVDVVIADKRLVEAHRLELSDGRVVHAGLSVRSV
ncbi:MAG: isoleucyl-tRNA synthetase [Acidimicrobiaceae bacterium]|jgi:isoleucyl-tRNA synthetase